MNSLNQSSKKILKISQKSPFLSYFWTFFKKPNKNNAFPVILSSVLALSIIAPINANAVAADPCGAVLCLSGVNALQGNLGECKPHIKKFFFI